MGRGPRINFSKGSCLYLRNQRGKDIPSRLKDILRRSPLERARVRIAGCVRSWHCLSLLASVSLHVPRPDESFDPFAFCLSHLPLSPPYRSPREARLQSAIVARLIGEKKGFRPSERRNDSRKYRYCAWDSDPGIYFTTQFETGIMEKAV